MKSRKSVAVRILLPVVLVGAISILLLALHSSKNTPPFPKSPAPHKQAEAAPVVVRYGVPVRIKIPKLYVDAAIDQMGVTSEGDMQSPSKPQNAGWYKFGPRPGNAGSAVIAGHYGPGKNGETTAFNELRKLVKGDRISVVDEKGTIITFKVRELRTYESNEIVPNVFRSNDGKAHLNLVTCQGAWDRARQIYVKRLVVFADRK